MDKPLSLFVGGWLIGLSLTAGLQAACPITQTDCHGVCVDVETDPQNCGSCDHACASGEFCTNAHCACCPDSFAICGTRCVDTSRDRAHCGRCDAPCGEGQVCSNGSCRTTCQTGLENCGGECVSTDRDRLHCGACGHRCDEGELCSAGQCRTTCQSNLENCGGSCVDQTTDRQNCGACGRACANGEICVDEDCVLTCAGGFADCSDQCVDLMTDERHCGGCDQPCEPFERCTGGACRVVCRIDQTDCDGLCVDLLVDRNHCGVCGRRCRDGQFCIAGFCRAPCAESGLTDCGNGALDAIVVDSAEPSLYVLENNRDSFLPALPFTGFPSALALAVGDADGDGDRDVVVTSQEASGGKLRIFVNEGSGHLAAGTAYDVGDEPRAVAMTDLDGDGRLDLLVLSYDLGQLETWLSQDPSGFAAQTPLDVGENPADMVVADFDRDGRRDVAVARPATADVGLWEWSDGGWSAQGSVSGLTAPVAIAAGPLDDDLYDDLAIVEFNDSAVAVALNNGNGTFGEPVSHATGQRPTAVALGFAPGDDLLDMATIDVADDTVTVMRNTGAALSFENTPYPFPLTPRHLRSADVNRDGFDDFLVVTEMDTMTNRGALTGLVSGSGGGYEYLPAVPVGTAPSAVATGDLVGGTVCVDIRCNRAHCGTCGRECAADEWCINGDCRLREDLTNDNRVDLEDYAEWILNFFGP